MSSTDITGSSDISDDDTETEDDTESDVVINSHGRSCKIVVENVSESLGMSLAPNAEGTSIYATNSEMPDKKAAVGMIISCIVPKGPKSKGVAAALCSAICSAICFLISLLCTAAQHTASRLMRCLSLTVLPLAHSTLPLAYCAAPRAQYAASRAQYAEVCA